MAATHSVELLNNYVRHLRNPLDPKVWKDRRLLVGDSVVLKWKQELDLVGELSEKLPQVYLIWDYRRWVVQKVGSDQADNAIEYELEFTKKILSKGPRNYQAWSQREWIIQRFNTSLWQKEVRFCHDILDEDIFNIPAWDQIYRAVTLNPHMEKECRDREAKYAKAAIYAQPGNECPWIYLKLLYKKEPTKLCTDPKLECICADVLSRAAFLVKSSLELDRRYNTAYALVDNRGCIYALNLIADLLTLGYEPNTNPKLVEAVNVLLENSKCSFLWVNYTKIKKGSEFSRKVRALLRSLNAFRIRYCYSYRGHNLLRDTRIYEEEVPTCGASRNELFQKHQGCFDMGRFITSLCEESICYENYFNSHPEFFKLLGERYDQMHLQVGGKCNLVESLTWADIFMNLKRYVVKYIGTNDVALAELQSNTDAIKENAYNHRAWSQRQWLFQTFGEDWEDESELSFCGEILEKDYWNSFAWDQRFFVVTKPVRKIYMAKSEICVDPDSVCARVRVFEEEFLTKRSIEVDFAIQVIESEPENELPWSHVASLNTARCGELGSDPKVTKMILRVLQNTKDCVVGLDAGDFLSGCEGGASLVNTRGVMNAINMLFDLNMNLDFDDRAEKDEVGRQLINVMETICPDKSLHDDLGVRDGGYGIDERTYYILMSLHELLAGHGLFWTSSADQYLRR